MSVYFNTFFQMIVKQCAKVIAILFSVTLIVSCAKENINSKEFYETGTVKVTVGAAAESTLTTRTDEVIRIPFDLGLLYLFCVTEEGMWQSIELCIENFYTGISDEISNCSYTFSVTGRSNGDMLIVSEDEYGFHSELLVPKGAKIFFSSVSNPQVDNDLSELVAPPSVNADVALRPWIKGGSKYGCHLYKSEQTTLKIVRGNLHWFGRELDPDAEFLQMYRMSGEFISNLFFYTQAGDNRPEAVGQAAFEEEFGALTDWNVYAYLQNYPYSLYMVKEDKPYVSGITDPLNLGDYLLAEQSFQLASKSFDRGEGEVVALNNTVAFTMNRGPHLFGSSFSGLGTALKFLLIGPDGSHFLVEIPMDGDTMLPNELKRYNVAVDIADLRSAKNQQITRSSEGCIQLPAQRW